MSTTDKIGVILLLFGGGGVALFAGFMLSRNDPPASNDQNSAEAKAPDEVKTKDE